MLNLQINNPELENDLKETFGDDTQSLGKAFFEFIQQQKIKQNIGVSIKQLDEGNNFSMDKSNARYSCQIQINPKLYSHHEQRGDWKRSLITFIGKIYQKLSCWIMLISLKPDCRQYYSSFQSLELQCLNSEKK